MGILRDFSDECGNSYTNAYFRAAQINIDAIGQNINLVFYGWKDADAALTGKQPLPGAIKQYNVTGEDFAAVAAAAPVGASLYDVLANACESYAIGKQDVDTGQIDANGDPVLASYFAGSTRV